VPAPATTTHALRIALTPCCRALRALRPALKRCAHDCALTALLVVFPNTWKVYRPEAIGKIATECTHGERGNFLRGFMFPFSASRIGRALRQNEPPILGGEAVC
jgi:hypothetical protein